jgi:HlyD family secretion protein
MAQQETRQSFGWVWAVVAILTLAGLFFYYKQSRSKVTVRAAQVERHDLTRAVSTNGNVEPVEDFEAHAPFSGTVQQVFVDVNEKVQKGQELVRMDDSDARKNLAAAQATLDSALNSLNNMKLNGTRDERLSSASDLAAAQTQLKQAQASERSYEALQAQGSASANEVASAKQRVADAQARISQLQARGKGRYDDSDFKAQESQVNEARASLAAAQAAYSAVDVRAPFSGTVYALPREQYDFAQAGDALVDLADLTHLRVRAYFDEPEVGKLAAGQPVTIVWEAKPNQIWHGHIFEAPTTIVTSGTRNVGECLITVDDANGDLLPNTHVTVKVTTLQRNNVLSIPREALHTEGDDNFVFKIVNDQLKKVRVVVGVVNLTRVEIVSGLNEGDTVALGATTDTNLSDGMRVKVQP